MSIFGVDLATPVTNAAAMRAAGVHFCCRYVSTPGNAKNLTKAEADRIKAAGMALVVVFETTANRALSGHAGGAADAASARTQAHACGAPATRPIYFAVDFDAHGQTTQTNTYLAGAASVLGKTGTGVYGGLAAVKAALDAGACHYAWQSYAWSGGVWDKRAQLQQYKNGQSLAGHSVDYDRAMTSDYGQWPQPKVIIGYSVEFTDLQGHKQTKDTKHPARWLLTHPRAKKRGRITVSRRFKT
jgi:hypothetical protein